MSMSQRERMGADIGGYLAEAVEQDLSPSQILSSLCDIWDDEGEPQWALTVDVEKACLREYYLARRGYR